jgi:hypothetical protein
MAYLVSKAITDVRRVLNDDTEDVWTDDDIIAYVNEAILIIKNTIPIYFDTLVEIDDSADTIEIESVYKPLITLFASARCFEQDEQDYRGQKQMNEFESRRVEMEDKILDSDAYQAKLDAAILAGTVTEDYVRDVYFEDYSEEDEIADLEP